MGWERELSKRWRREDAARARSLAAGEPVAASAAGDGELAGLEDSLGIPRGSLSGPDPVAAAAPAPYDPAANGGDVRAALEEELGAGPWSLPSEVRRAVVEVPPEAPNVPRTGARTVTDRELRRMLPS